MTPRIPPRPADEPLTVSAAYDGDPARVAEARAVARRFVGASQSAFGQTAMPEDQDTVELVVSELLTNSCLHAPGRVLLTLTATPHTVDVSVWDSVQAAPVLCRGDAERGHQYGMQIVTALSDHVSVHTEPFGKRISVTVPLTKGATGDPVHFSSPSAESPSDLSAPPRRTPDSQPTVPAADGTAPSRSPDAPPPPSNAFVPVPGCWTCALLHSVAVAARYGEEGLELRHWLSVTASGMQHRMHDHGLPPQDRPGCGP